MEIQSRLLTVDFYDCKGDRCSTEEALRDQVSDALRTVGLSPIEIISSGQESGVLSLLALVPGGHVALHVHPAMRQVQDPADAEADQAAHGRRRCRRAVPLTQLCDLPGDTCDEAGG